MPRSGYLCKFNYLCISFFFTSPSPTQTPTQHHQAKQKDERGEREKRGERESRGELIGVGGLEILENDLWHLLLQQL
ncbi:hypothetical protein LOK49_LG08G00031 [Camellia lanceoleosa]|uniref:Uncharacterized protein n=1 Tax=Camellia lanceoleosa TaxID=1840588 RepID=A0ACC0GVH2_9ERIC|nr:hypothetical protein LOK49_LG08G00031 [Camellia lanceoleosa]